MIAIKKNTDGYLFFTEAFHEDPSECVLVDLGSASMRVQDEGTEDELRWFEGYLDTRAVSFDDEDELVRIVKRRFPDDDVMVTDAADEYWNQF